jgi:large subunit ribosomal protein L13e
LTELKVGFLVFQIYIE